jgi:hypothetical protein
MTFPPVAPILPTSVNFRHLHSDAADIALRELVALYSDDPNGPNTLWQLISERSGVRSYSRPPTAKSEVIMPVVRGDGIIQGWTQEDVRAVLVSFGARKLCTPYAYIDRVRGRTL